MKVRELIEQLQKCDPERKIILICEDEDIVRSDRLLETFMIESVSQERVVVSNHPLHVGDRLITFDKNNPEAHDVVIMNLDFKF